MVVPIAVRLVKSVLNITDVKEILSELGSYLVLFYSTYYKFVPKTMSIKYKRCNFATASSIHVVLGQTYLVKKF